MKATLFSSSISANLGNSGEAFTSIRSSNEEETNWPLHSCVCFIEDIIVACSEQLTVIISDGHCSLVLAQTDSSWLANQTQHHTK